MKLQIVLFPKSALGRWSIGLAIAWILSFVLAELSLGPGPDYNMALAITFSIIVTAIGVAAFVTGIMSIVRDKERSISVFIAALIGFYSLFGSALSSLSRLFNK